MTAKKKVPALKIKVGAESSEPAVQAVANTTGDEYLDGIMAKTEKKAEQAKEPATMDEGETIKNPRTGSVFHVLGATKEGLRVSIRFYKESSPHGHTVLGFRLRIGDQSPVGAQEYVLIENVKDFMRKKYPQFASSMSATPVGTVYPHVSIEGMFDIPVFPWDKMGLMDYLTKEPFSEELRDIVALFCTGGNFSMGLVFHAFIMGLILGTVETSKPPEAPKGKMKWVLGVSGARLMTSDKTKITKKEALNQAGL